ncbi:MAG: PQQ-dependent sugar dehydrogenase [Patescibacteria group bacterium]
MKKILIIISTIIVIVAAIFAGRFYWRNLRGIKPAIAPPSADISKIINTTGMPLNLPPGWQISIFAKDLVNPRVMIKDGAGHLLVSVPSEGRVVAIEEDGGIKSLAENLNQPHGLALLCKDECRLYIAETDKINAYDYDGENLSLSNKQKLADLPGGGNHFTRTLGFGPNGRLYVSIGSDCNVCNESDARRAKIYSMNPDGSDFKEVARGLRNSVFFIWDDAGRMLATEMGRDLLGDDTPSDEINIIEEGKNYGWPICYGQNVHDTDFDKNTYIRNPCMTPFETPSFIDIPAHSAPLGLAFSPADGWPEEYAGNLFVAYHGSWNRSAPTGYKIVRYKFDAAGNPLPAEDFITGWLKDDGGVYGRPVDILAEPYGVIYISDDKAGVIYRVDYMGI